MNTLSSGSPQSNLSRLCARSRRTISHLPVSVTATKVSFSGPTKGLVGLSPVEDCQEEVPIPIRQHGCLLLIEYLQRDLQQLDSHKAAQAAVPSGNGGLLNDPSVLRSEPKLDSL